MAKARLHQTLPDERDQEMLIALVRRNGIARVLSALAKMQWDGDESYHPHPAAPIEIDLGD
jgi:hypothetical protein